jgi:alkylhydroperoxidase family enzyme
MSKFETRVGRLLERLVAEAGQLPSEVRQAVLRRAAAAGGATLEGGEVPDTLAPWVDAVAQHAHRTTDEDVARLRTAGFSEDQIFETTLCAATGAAWARLDRGLAVLRRGR